MRSLSLRGEPVVSTPWRDNFKKNVDFLSDQRDIINKKDQIDMANNSLAPGDSGGPMICQSYEGDCVSRCRGLLGSFRLFTSKSSYDTHPLSNSFSNRMYKHCVENGSLTSADFQKITEETVIQAKGQVGQGANRQATYLEDSVSFTHVSMTEIPEDKNKPYQAKSVEDNSGFLSRTYFKGACRPRNDAKIVALNQAIVKRGGNSFAVLGNNVISTNLAQMSQCDPTGFKDLSNEKFERHNEATLPIKMMVEDCKCQQNLKILDYLSDPQQYNKEIIDISGALDGWSYPWASTTSIEKFTPQGNPGKSPGDPYYPLAGKQGKAIVDKLKLCDANMGKTLAKLQAQIDAVAFTCRFQTTNLLKCNSSRNASSASEASAQ